MPGVTKLCWSLRVAKNVERLRALVFGAAFAAFSGAVAFGWLYGVDLWVLRAAQEHSSGLLDAAASVFSLPGRAEIGGWCCWRCS